MSLRKDTEDGFSFNDLSYENDPETLSHKKRVRKMLEDRLEKKRMREELDELDGEFDWDDLDK